MSKNRDYSRKRVLMLCYYFPPCPRVGALRSGKFVKYLGRFGWSSEVLTAYRGLTKEYESNQYVKIHPTIRIDLNEVISKLASVFHFCRNFLIKCVIIFKSGKHTNRNVSSQSKLLPAGGLGISTYIQRWLLLPDPQCLWVLTALPAALFKARRCDVIYSSVWPLSTHVLGLIVHKITKKPWVADYRDEWSLNCAWRPPTRFHKWLGEKLDKACVENADIIINTTEISTRRFIDKFGGGEEKFVTIPNGYDEDDIAKFRDIKPDGRAFVMTSIGSLYGGRDAKPFFRAVARLVKGGVIERQKLNIKLIGGQNPDPIKEVEKLEIGNIVQIVPRIPQEDAFMELAKSHIAVLVGSGMEKVAMTTKVYEYASMRKPILALVPHGPVYDFVKKCGGWCARPDDVKEIEQTLTGIFETYQNGWPEIKVPADIKKYDRRELTGQLALHLDRCINRSQQL